LILQDGDLVVHVLRWRRLDALLAVDSFLFGNAPCFV